MGRCCGNIAIIGGQISVDQPGKRALVDISGALERGLLEVKKVCRAKLNCRRDAASTYI